MSGDVLRLAVTHPGGEYEVIVGRALLPELRDLAQVNDSLAIISDSNVGPLYARKCGQADCYITIPAGERQKTLATVKNIYHELLAAGIDRGGTIVALGGGVVGDIAGFAAATYLRGVALVQCPTSLLAMVDASIGGKTGVDMREGKNLVGAFKQPRAVIADVSTLQSLPDVEFVAGMAEVVKHGLIAAPEILDRLESGEIGAQTSAVRDNGLETLILSAIRVKRDIVQDDPFEQGGRAVLNLGHTFAHAIEQLTRYRVRHGHAVAMGLVAAANLSAAMGFCPADLQHRVEALLTRLGLPTRFPSELEPEAMLAAMARDKKSRAGRLRYVLLRKPGDVFVTGDVPVAAVRQTLSALREVEER